MNYVLDILGCALVCITEVFALFFIAILIQGIVYRTTKFSIFNAIKDFIVKEINN